MDEFKLPDFDDMLKIAEEIGVLTTTIAIDKAIQKELKANISRVVTSQEKYFVKDKPPAMNYIESDYHELGYDDDTGAELFKLKRNLAENEGRLEFLKNKFNVLRDMIDVWRAQQYAKREVEY